MRKFDVCPRGTIQVHDMSRILEIRTIQSSFTEPPLADFDPMFRIHPVRGQTRLTAR